MLKRVWESETTGLSTYYLYDDFGNLRYVVPPAVSASFTEGDSPFNEYIYAYRYDSRNRVTDKKIPGKGWEEMMYNTLDQVVLSRDKKQADNHEWMYTKYDAFGRVTSTGIYSSAADRSTLQTSINTGPKWDTWTGSSYDNAAFPNTSINQLAVNYYDDYSFGVGSYTFKVGAGLVNDLMTSTNNTEIVQRSTNAADDLKGAYVLWNPNGTNSAPDQTGSTQRPSYIGLGHELAHVQDNWNGTINRKTWQSVTDPNGNTVNIPNAEIYLFSAESPLGTLRHTLFVLPLSIMPVRRTITESQGIYFITFTCARWLKLFELTNSYHLVYH